MHRFMYRFRQSTPVPLLVAGLFALGLTGCGLIFGGSNQTIPMASSPEGATVEFHESGRTLTTPTSVKLKRKDSYVLTFSREGFESRQVELERSLRGGMLALDILFTGLVGVVVDAATGGWYELSPERLDVTLTRLEAAADGPEEIRVRLYASDGEDDEAPRLHMSSDLPVKVRIERKD